MLDPGHRAGSLDATASPIRPPDGERVIAEARIRGENGERPACARQSSGSTAADARRTAGRQLVAVAADDLPFAVHDATVAALTTGQSWPDALPGTLKMRRRQLGGLIAAQLPDVPGQPPQATYLAWLDCRHIADGGQPRNVFPGRGRVALEPGPRLGTPGSGFVRLNLGTSEAVLAEAIERIASALS
jgi:bifunctional pyridoxal-dependent enzyme with beta-cystathionase and maltose regulon repressor activities